MLWHLKVVGTWMAAKITGKEFERGRNKTPQPTPRGHEQARALRGPRDPRPGSPTQAGWAGSEASEGPEPSPRPASWKLHSPGTGACCRWGGREARLQLLGPFLSSLPGREGRNPPSASGSRPSPPSSTHPEAASGVPAAPGGASRNYLLNCPAGENCPGWKQVLSRDGGQLWTFRFRGPSPNIPLV